MGGMSGAARFLAARRGDSSIRLPSISSPPQASALRQLIDADVPAIEGELARLGAPDVARD